MMTAMKTVIIFHSCSLSADHEVRDTYGHADESVVKKYVSPWNNCGDTRERWPAIKDFL